MNPIFITGRFCTGTTFLWNFFDWMEDYCAYYEPLHPGLLASVNYITPNEKHKGVTDYWKEYRKINNLASCYAPSFGFDQLALSEKNIHTNLKNYINYLISNNSEKRVAIKFNRIDFRLGWISKNFPEAKIIHIKRNIRDTWLSTRAHLPPESKNDMFQFNAYELTQWAIALDDYFPFIIDNSTSSYHLHYFLAKLSEQFSRYYAHVTIDFDNDITQDFNVFIEKMSAVTGIKKDKIEEFSSKRVISSAKTYTLEEIKWLEQAEAQCDKVLNSFRITEMSPEELLQKSFSPLFPEKRKAFMQNLLAYSYQLEDEKISLRGKLDIELRKTLASRISAKIKEKLLGK